MYINSGVEDPKAFLIFVGIVNRTESNVCVTHEDLLLL